MRNIILGLVCLASLSGCALFKERPAYDPVLHDNVERLHERAVTIFDLLYDEERAGSDFAYASDYELLRHMYDVQKDGVDLIFKAQKGE